MKITRRSFVKKSSYTAAAVTVLGAGVALSAEPSGPKKKVCKFKVQPVSADFDKTFDVPTGLTNAEALSHFWDKVAGDPGNATGNLVTPPADGTYQITPLGCITVDGVPPDSPTTEAPMTVPTIFSPQIAPIAGAPAGKQRYKVTFNGNYPSFEIIVTSKP